MKKLVFSLIAIAMFGIGNAQYKLIKMDLPKSIQSPAGPSETIVQDVSFKTKSGLESRGQIRYVIPDKGKGLISLEFSENILTAGNIGSDFYVTAQAFEEGSQTKSELATCLDFCQKAFTDADGKKIPGRGWCKAGCWLEATIRVLPILTALINIK